jgi:sec-independent protein translocase protein TatC
MYLLKKVFQLRDKSNPDMEKPFLEHLEDLRIMITRVVLTLLISTIGCFVLQEQVMEVLRRPVQDVWSTHVKATLPETLDIEDWEQAKTAFEHSLALPEGERQLFLSQFDAPVPRLARAVAYLRAAKGLPEDKQDAYFEAIVQDDAELKRTLKELSTSGTDPGTEPNLSMMSALAPTETFMLSMKLAFFAGTVVSFPFLLFFILQFILPGLHNNERKILWPSMAVGFGLFLAGVLFAYFVVLPRALGFFFEWDRGLGVASDWRIGWYIGFATQFTLLFGLSFELPVVIMALVKLGLLSYEMMSRTRSYAVLTIVVLAAMITPTGDIITLSLMAVPMYILYEACILLAWIDRKKERERKAEEDSEEEARLKRLLKDTVPDEAAQADHDPTADHDSLDHDITEEDEEEDIDDPYWGDTDAAQVDDYDSADPSDPDSDQDPDDDDDYDGTDRPAR